MLDKKNYSLSNRNLFKNLDYSQLQTSQKYYLLQICFHWKQSKIQSWSSDQYQFIISRRKVFQFESLFFFFLIRLPPSTKSKQKQRKKSETIFIFIVIVAPSSKWSIPGKEKSTGHHLHYISIRFAFSKKERRNGSPRTGSLCGHPCDSRNFLLLDLEDLPEGTLEVGEAGVYVCVTKLWVWLSCGSFETR